MKPSVPAFAAICELMIYALHYDRENDSDEPLSHNEIMAFFVILGRELSEEFGNGGLMEFVYNFAKSDDDMQFDVDSVMNSVIKGDSGLAVDVLLQMGENNE